MSELTDAQIMDVLEHECGIYIAAGRTLDIFRAGYAHALATRADAWLVELDGQSWIAYEKPTLTTAIPLATRAGESDAPVNRQGEADYLRTVADLQEVARKAPHVTQDWILAIRCINAALSGTTDERIDALHAAAEALAAQPESAPEGAK